MSFWGTVVRIACRRRCLCVCVFSFCSENPSRLLFFLTSRLDQEIMSENRRFPWRSTPQLCLIRIINAKEKDNEITCVDFPRFERQWRRGRWEEQSVHSSWNRGRFLISNENPSAVAFIVKYFFRINIDCYHMGKIIDDRRRKLHRLNKHWYCLY